MTVLCWPALWLSERNGFVCRGPAWRHKCRPLFAVQLLDRRDSKLSDAQLILGSTLAPGGSSVGVTLQRSQPTTQRERAPCMNPRAPPCTLHHSMWQSLACPQGPQDRFRPMPRLSASPNAMLTPGSAQLPDAQPLHKELAQLRPQLCIICHHQERHGCSFCGVSGRWCNQFNIPLHAV